MIVIPSVIKGMHLIIFLVEKRKRKLTLNSFKKKAIVRGVVKMSYI